MVSIQQMLCYRKMKYDEGQMHFHRACPFGGSGSYLRPSLQKRVGHIARESRGLCNTPQARRVLVCTVPGRLADTGALHPDWEAG